MGFKNKKDIGKKKDNKVEQETNKDYPNYEALTREEAKALLELRLKKKPQGIKAPEKVREPLDDSDVKIFNREEKAQKRQEAKDDRFLERMEKTVKEDDERYEKEVRRVREEEERTKKRQEQDLEKLLKRDEKEELKKQEESGKTKKKVEKKELKAKIKEEKKKEKERKRERSFVNRIRRYRDARFAMTDQKYYEKEEQQKQKDKQSVRDARLKLSENKKKDRQDKEDRRKAIKDRKARIIEREFKKAKERAKFRELRIQETFDRRKAKTEEYTLLEKAYIDCVAARERMLEERALKKAKAKTHRDYLKTLPKEQRLAETENYNKLQREERETYLKKREEILHANRNLPKEERKEVPPKTAGSLRDRIGRKASCYFKKRVLIPVKIKHEIIGRKAIISNRMALIIDGISSKNDRIDDAIEAISSALSYRAYRIRLLTDRHKEVLFGTLTGVIIVIILTLSFFNYVTGYEYAYNKRVIGVVKNQEELLALVDIINEQLSKEHEAMITIDKNKHISFKRVFIMGKDVDNQEKALRKLTYMRDLPSKGNAIFIEGVRVGVLNNKEDAERALNSVLNNYLSTSKDTEYESVGFAEKIEIKEIDTRLGGIETVDEVTKKILTGGKRTESHVVEPGETAVSVAQKYNISVNQLIASNLDLDVRQLLVGQTLYLTEAVPMVKVQTVEVTKYIEYIPFATTYQDDSKIWEGELTTKVQGKNGEREVVAKIVRNNGKETAKKILEERLLAEPKQAVVLVGTKPPPPLKGTGTFIYPVTNYTLTSRFGMRWGRLHAGIDMAAPVGTKIRAADGGTVVMAGYNGELGYCVEVDHGANIVSVYGHCSKLYVSVGEQVYQGQHIADVGSTGRSTGSHLHFEVRVLGVAKNPFEYL